MSSLVCRPWAATHVGRKREHNEDSHLVDRELQLFIVADGMGGHACGEVASAMAVEVFHDAVLEERDLIDGFRGRDPEVSVSDLRNLLHNAMLTACREVFQLAQQDAEKRGMGTTCSALLVAGNRGIIAHVGDSRIYLVRNGRAVQLTRDHTVFNELLQSGDLDASIANNPRFDPIRNALARAVGVTPEVEVDTSDFEVLPEDTFVLGSDGMTYYVPAEELPAIVAMEPSNAPSRMVDLSNERGGHDNITALAVRLETVTGEDTAAADHSAEFARKVEAFEKIPLFRFLEYEQMIRVLSLTHVEQLKSGTLVVREGAGGSALYVVLAGAVTVLKGESPVAELRSGSHFGELALIDRSPRSASVVVKDDARLLVLKRPALYDLVQREPEIGVRLLWCFAETFAERLRKTTADLVDARESHSQEGSAGDEDDLETLPPGQART